MADSEMTVRAVAEHETNRASRVLANAFCHDPIFRFVLGDRCDAEVRLDRFFRGAVEAELRKPAHLVETVGSAHAVALWHDVGEWKTPTLALLRSLPSVVRTFGTGLPRALRILAGAEKVHPSEPHRHLAFIGTHDDHHGKGLGSALLGSMIERCDDEGIATYLESTNPANDAWYARFGFESRGPVPLSAGAPILTAMWRDPR